MNRTLIAATAALATLAGTTSAFAQEEITCEDLLAAYTGEDEDVTLTDGTLVCEYENGILVGEGEADQRIQDLLDAIDAGEMPELAEFGLETALRARDGGVDGQDQAMRARDRADERGGEGSEQGSQRAEQGSQRAGNAGGRENAGGRP